MSFKIQSHLRRGRTADRLGMALFVALLVVLVASVYRGVVAFIL